MKRDVMRRRRHNPLPLMLGLLFAAAVHLAAAPPATYLLSRADRRTLPADLRVENLIVPDDLLRLGEPNSVSFDVVNRGTAPTSAAAWVDCIYYSTDDTLDAGDMALATLPRTGPLEPGAGYRAHAPALRLPPGAATPFYLIFRADVDGDVGEDWQHANNVRVRRFDAAEHPDEPRVAVGRDDAPQRVTVAWISHDDFQDLVARQSVTEQPAIQNQVEPVPAAPPEPDPTPPLAEPLPTEPRTPAESGGTLAQTPAPTDPTAPPLPDVPEPDIAPAPTAGPPAPAQPDLQQTPGDGNAAADAAPASRDEPARPTQTPRAEGEASPTQRYPRQLDVQPGRTVVGPGIEITTARPDFSPVARASTLPDNPRAVLTFDRTGAVIDAHLTRSSGSPNVDAPILRSFYKWKAKGKQIDELQGNLEIPVTIILLD